MTTSNETTMKSKLAGIRPALVLLALATACGVPSEVGTTGDSASGGATDSGSSDGPSGADDADATGAASQTGGKDATGGDDSTWVTGATGGQDGTDTTCSTEGLTVTGSAGLSSSTDDSTSTDGSSSSDTAETPIGAIVDLGEASGFVILAASAISTVPPSVITGDVGLSPAAATGITGFSLIADGSNTFSTSPQIAGSVYAADYAVPTPAYLTIAVGDMQSAFTEAAGRAPDVIALGGGSIGGMTIDPGVYQWSSGLLISADVELNGGSHDVWIFQIAEDLLITNGTSVSLAGGAQPQNVFWQVSGMVNLGTTAHCEGVVLSQTSISLATNASVNGRLLAQTAVTLDRNTVTEPAS